MTKARRAMTKASSNPDALIEWEALREQIMDADNYWVCTPRPDGSSHAEAVWGAMLDDSFYLGSGQRSIKNRYISQNTEIAVHMESGADTLIMEGRAVLIDDLAIAEQLLPIYAMKYPYRTSAAELLKHGLYRVELSLVLAWKDSDFTRNAKRWVFKKGKAA